MPIYKKHVLLPDEYQEVEYIENTGGSYIDANFMLLSTQNRLDYDVKCSVDRGTTPDTNNEKNIFSNGKCVVGFITHNNQVEIVTAAQVANSTYWDPIKYAVPDAETVEITGYFSKTGFGNNYIGDTVVAKQPYNDSYSFYLFRNRVNANRPYKGKIYKVRFSIDGTEVRNFVPCYRKSDSVIGLYDLTNDVFYTNAGTDTFAKGNDVVNNNMRKVDNIIKPKIGHNLPKAYKEVEYIESTTIRQLLDTGIVPNSGKLSIYVDFKFDTIPSGTTRFACCGNDFGTAGGGIGFGVRNNEWSDIEPGSSFGTFGTANTNRIKTIWTIDGSTGSSTLSGDLEHTQTSTTHYGNSCAWRTQSVCLFRANDGVALDTTTELLRMYEVVITINDVLVGHFIPCYRVADNEIGMYDIIRDVFISNIGQDNFTKGSDITTKTLNFTKCIIKGQVPYFNWLPSEYQEVEYIYKTGGLAYIDTGRKGKLNTKAEVKFKYTTLPSSTSIVAGARGTSSTTDAFVMGVTSGHEYYARFGNGTPTENRQAYDTNTHIMINSVDGGYIDGIKIATYPSQSSYETPYPVALFASRENDGTITFNALYCRIYYYKVWESNKLVQYLIPCYRKSDNVYGMYDIISRQFLTNANTSGTFVGGKAIYYSLPSEFQRVEYIKSTGTQYIDTGIVPTDTFGCSVDISYPELPSNAVAEFGCRQDSSSTRCFWVVGTTGKSYVGWNGTYPPSDAQRPDTTPNTWYNIKLNYKNDRTFKQDNVIVSSDLPTLSSSIAKNFLFFACNNQTSSPSSPLNITKRENSVKQAIITNGNEVVMKLIPCFRKADGEIGMFDLVNGIFYTNAGTGTFERGRAIIENDKYQEVEYIESDGNQHLETNYYPGLNTEVIADYMLTAYNGTEVNYIFGEYESNKMCAIYKRSSANSDKFGVMFGTLDATTSLTMDLNTTYNVVLNKTEATVNGTSVKEVGASTDFTSSKNMYIFRGNGSSRPSAIMKLYDFIVKENAVRVMHLIPCYRKADNVIGMYDIIGGTFLTNAGTGTFTKGNDI